MPPIIKETDTLTAKPESPARAGQAQIPSGDSVKQQPVALEIAVTVNGARAMDGSDKREPFSESTKTVLVFGSGAVIRLTSSVAPGQLLFLTNERSKKEVVCQVVKSKNYRNVSGYVEIEFTEPAVGFWGMRFPGDRIGPGPQAASAAIRPPVTGNGAATRTSAVAQKTELPAASSSSSVPAKPSSPAPVYSKPAPPAPAPSIVPPPMDSAALLGAAKAKGDSGAPSKPVATSPDADTPLMEPWLKKREPARPPAAPESTAPTTPTFELSRSSDVQASIFASTPQTLQGPANVDLSSLTPFFEVKPAAADVPAAPAPSQTPAAKDPEAEELKQQTARLREELSKMQFAEPASSKPAEREMETPSFPVSEESISTLKRELKTESVHESPVRLVEHAEPSKETALLAEAPKLEEPLKIEPAAPIAALGPLEPEEMKIPAWLEPLARNASAPSSTQELVLREKAKRVAEQPKSEEPEEIIAETVLPVQRETAPEPRMPEFGGMLPIDEVSHPAERQSKGSGKGMLFAAIAAGVLIVVGGGWWYMNQQSAGVHAGAASTPAPADSVPALTPSSQPQRETPIQANSSAPANPAASRTAPVQTRTVAEINVTAKSSSSAPAVPAASSGRSSQTSPNSPNGGKVVTASSTVPPEPVPAEVKKPILGEVRLAAPKVKQNRKSQSVPEADAGSLLSEDEPENNADSLGAGLVVGGKEPVAPATPLPVGGDVKQAKLISKVNPVYPTVAKNQHVSGNVTIDALIDATGRVTTMKIVSGPTLLHQAAMDALKQWKYQPATLDGKAVPMHLSVTLQFRLQ